MKAKLVKESLTESLNESTNTVSKYKKNMEVKIGNDICIIKKVNNLNSNIDEILLYRNGKPFNTTSKWLDGNAEIIGKAPIKRNRPKNLYTIRKYEKELKDSMESLKDDQGEDVEHALIYDVAENMLYDEDFKNYAIKRYFADEYGEDFSRYGSSFRVSTRDLIEFVTNELERYA